MGLALRPILRLSQAPSILSSRSPATYVCISCRSARLIRRPKRPYTFTQLVTLSDGSAFTMRTTSPLPVYRSTRDTRNAPLWNPSSKELLNVESDEAGRLSGFRARFGRGFDAGREPTPTTDDAAESDNDMKKEGTRDAKLDAKKESPYDDNGFGEEDDDASLLDLITSFGQDRAQSTGKKSGGKKR